MRRSWFPLFVLASLMGCTLDRGGLVEPGADAEVPSPTDAAPRDAQPPPGDAEPPPDDAQPPPMDAGPVCVPSEEVCDAEGVDEDCDGVANEGCDCTVGQTRACTPAAGCDGVQTCVDGAWGDCVAETPVQTCNGLDDDCDGTVDEGSACAVATGCDTHTYMGHGYLFCAAVPQTFREAEAYCQMFGYHLATVNDEAEDRELIGELRGPGERDRYWIGYEDEDGDGSFDWVHGASTYENANTAGRGECTLLDSSARDWGGDPCDRDRRFICESP